MAKSAKKPRPKEKWDLDRVFGLWFDTMERLPRKSEFHIWLRDTIVKAVVAGDAERAWKAAYILGCESATFVVMDVNKMNAKRLLPAALAAKMNGKPHKPGGRIYTNEEKKAAQAEVERLVAEGKKLGTARERAARKTRISVATLRRFSGQQKKR
jgi:hypothetical protein